MDIVDVVAVDTTPEELRNQGHSVVVAHEVCPHVWETIDQASESGYLDLTQLVHILMSCKDCMSLVFDSSRAAVSRSPMGPAEKFFITNLLTKARERVMQRKPAK